MLVCAYVLIPCNGPASNRFYLLKHFMQVGEAEDPSSWDVTSEQDMEDEAPQLSEKERTENGLALKEQATTCFQ